MEISQDVLRKGISLLSDEELRRRWESKQFSDAALPIAEAELLKRSIDYSDEGIRAASSKLEEEVREAKAVRSFRLLQSSISSGMAAGMLLGLGFLGAIAGFGVGWLIGGPIAKFVNNRISSRPVRIAVGIAIVLCMFLLCAVVSTVAGLVIGATLRE